MEKVSLKIASLHPGSILKSVTTPFGQSRFLVNKNPRSFYVQNRQEENPINKHNRNQHASLLKWKRVNISETDEIMWVSSKEWTFIVCKKKEKLYFTSKRPHNK